MESARLQQKERTNETERNRSLQPRSVVSTPSHQPLTFSEAQPPVLQLGQRFGSLRPLKTKLTINEPGDEYEQEADRVAEQVMRMPDPAIRLQRKCGCGGSGSSCEECGEAGSPVIRLQSAERSNTALQRVAEPKNGSVGRTAPAIVHDVLSASGQPLESSTRAFFEARFAHDFSRVRVHTDARAAESARAINALAYTVGQDIVFSQGQYAPTQSTGQRLISHELAHVCQNANGSIASQLNRYESHEHQDLAGAYLRSLVPFLETDEGERWASSMGLDRRDLIRRILNDPEFIGRDIEVRMETDPATGRQQPFRLSAAQIVSLMGDFFDSPEALAQAPAREISRILSVMRAEGEGTMSASQAALQYEEITGGRYLRLAAANDTHFAILNKREWRRLHEQAIAVARTASGANQEAQFQQALLIDAAAGHFLTDAFAAGHLFPKQRVLASIAVYLRAHPVTAQNPAMQTYLGVISLAGRMDQLVLKNIHDRMNREGFEVANDRGMRWRTFGDNSLSLAQETQRIAALAVFLSRQQIIAVRGNATAAANPAEIESLMPNDDTIERATQQAIAYIPDAARDAESLIYRNRALAPTQFGVFGPIIESNISTIGHPGREQEIMNMLDSARRIGVDAPVLPSFTIATF